MLTWEEVLYEMRKMSSSEEDAQAAALEYLEMRWKIDWERRIKLLFLDIELLID